MTSNIVTVISHLLKKSLTQSKDDYLFPKQTYHIVVVVKEMHFLVFLVAEHFLSGSIKEVLDYECFLCCYLW